VGNGHHKNLLKAVPTRPESRRSEVDLMDLAAASQVESFQFQVAGEIFHSSRRRILG